MHLSSALYAGFVGTLLVCVVDAQSLGSSGEWPVYAADHAATKYSPLDQINRETVSTLGQAWEWKPGERDDPRLGTRPGKFESTPLMIDNVLYLSTPYARVVALDAESGAQIWAYDPKTYEDGQGYSGI